MVYDFIKILKKCLKFWYVFVGTFVLLIAAMFIFIRPITTYKSSCTISINNIDKKKVINDTGNIDYFNSLNDSVVEIAKEFYIKDNLDEINNKFATGGNLKLRIDTYKVLEAQMYNFEISHPNKELCKQVLDFIKTDFVDYVSEVVEQEIPVEYRTANTYKVYNESSPAKTLQDSAFNFCLISIGSIVVEIIVFGVLTLKNNKIEFEEEINSEFNTNALVKDYNKNIEQAFKAIKSNNLENSIIICEDVDYCKKIFNDLAVTYRACATVKDVNDLDLKEKNIIIEIVKSITEKNKIEKVVNELNKVGFKNYYFITRTVEKKNESSSNK